MKYILYTLALVLFFSCSNRKPELQIEVVKQAHLSNLPSASGIEYSNDLIYMVGDDMRWLVSLDDEWQVIEKFPLSAIDTLVNNRTPWNLKADFEAIANFNFENNDYLLVASSGSKAIFRDTAHLVLLADSTILFKKNIRALYEEIKTNAGIPESNEINIEGLAISNKTAFFFHRGNVYENFIVEMDLSSLMNYLLMENIPKPEFNVYQFELPSYNNIPSGFSGACLLSDQSGILYTASLEDTESELYDGNILGSFIGYIPIENLSLGTSYATLLTDKKQVPINKKLESIVIKSKTDNKLVILSVSDNDDGSSDIFEMNLYLNNLD